MVHLPLSDNLSPIYSICLFKDTDGLFTPSKKYQSHMELIWNFQNQNKNYMQKRDTTSNFLLRN